MTAALVCNLITLPVFVVPVAGGWMPPLGVQLIAEVVIWLVEAALLFLILRRSLSFRSALGRSLVMNAASFTIGLALPV